MDPGHLKVLGLMGATPGAVEVYRTMMPLAQLNGAGHRCFWMPFPTHREWAREGKMQGILDHDLIVLGRPIAKPEEEGDIGTWTVAARARGARIAYECDDDYTGWHRPPEQGRTCLPWLRFVDAITVTNKRLAGVMDKAAGGRKPVYILPNAIDVEGFAERAAGATGTFARAQNEIRVMVAGTETHFSDWRPMEGAVRLVKEKHPEVRFLIGGFLPYYLVDVCDRFLEPVPYERYPAMLAQADILCAIIDPDDAFNLSKSPVKALEGWAARRPVPLGKRVAEGGCAVIATDCAVYRGAVEHRHNGLLVRRHTAEAWAEAILTLIEDPLLRRRLQVEGHRDVRRYDIRRHWREWEAAYKSILLGG